MFLIVSGSCFRWKLSFQVTSRKESVSPALVANVSSLRQRINLPWRMGGWLGLRKTTFGAHFSFLSYFNLLILTKLFIILCTWLPVLQIKICSKWGNVYFFWSFSLCILCRTRVLIFPRIGFKGCVKWIRQYYRSVISFVSVYNFNILSIFFAELALSS